MDKRIPLGHIKLDVGTKPIHAMHDFFLNYTFNKKENWGLLRLMVNIFLQELARQQPGVNVRLIKGDVSVETQYKYYLNILSTPKSQDFRIKPVYGSALYYCEFQNRANPKTPIKLQAADYQAQSIKHAKDKATRQIWFLAEDVGELLGGENFASFVTKDEISGRPYPLDTSLTFVSLTQLSRGNGTASQLASFLLGSGKKIRCSKVKRIANAFRRSVKLFCKDKGVRTRMSVAEKYREEGWEEGIEEGISIGVKRVAELVNAGYSVDDAIKIASGGKSD